ncbi:MAG: bifunctional lysine ketoglutarate reductase /saccharopine dehydrogenase family protein [Planctomycetota bacterium]|nr:bifunctional lysine ketoglutarate reductase /saccharopine dehydrogenase family protein [Planctomycetota bacterium]
MPHTVAIRREDKNIWERRSPLTPQQVTGLSAEHGIKTVVQSSAVRAFTDAEYSAAGAAVQEDIGGCKVVLAIKEIPLHLLHADATYVFFSHTAKGQAYNMPMLRRLLELKCTLIDYEKIVDEKGRRVVLFGNFAGLAGMIDSLWALGGRLKYEGIPTPLAKLHKTYEYASLDAAKEAVAAAGEEIKKKGLPKKIAPFVCGFAGYGNVYAGASQIFDLLPHKTISPAELAQLYSTGTAERKAFFKVVFKEEDSVRPKEKGAVFALQDYYSHPEKYEGRFIEYVPHLGMLMNCVYWEKKYPRLISKEGLKALHADRSRPFRLRVIGDISCDVEGGIECTVRSTTPSAPIFVYNPEEGTIKVGWVGDGVVVLAVDNLPCELPKESSDAFGGQLIKFVPALASADYDKPFEESSLPPIIKDAVLVYRGQFTPKYKYMAEFL